VKAILLKPIPKPWLGFYRCINCGSVFEIDESDNVHPSEYQPNPLGTYLNRDCPHCGERGQGLLNLLVLFKITQEKAIELLEEVGNVENRARK
jgi:rubredoxin